tara:strand:+ start:3235 stop:3513 length:279 start_codon:yes stop_codon:yes gene_type:complete
MSRINELIDRVEKLDPDLAEELHHEAGVEWHRRTIRRAEDNLRSTMSTFSRDMTGQDGEDEINAAATDLIASRDDKIRYEDPERWAEMQMGA